MKKDAKLSECRKYRYALWRTWDQTKPLVMFIGLNPSTADEQTDDPTLIRCINYATTWGYGGVCMANLFSYRATAPEDMLTTSDPVGEENDQWLLKLSKTADLVIAAWGNMGIHIGRSEQVKKLILNLYCLKINKSGEPSHPLYLKTDLKPVKMQLIETAR